MIRTSNFWVEKPKKILAYTHIITITSPSSIVCKYLWNQAKKSELIWIKSFLKLKIQHNFKWQ